LKEIKQSQVDAFRLARHHFLDKKPLDLVTVSRNICGVQAQIITSAHLALRARLRSVKPEEIENSLYTTRKLVKTHLMRQTLHLIPSDEFSLYINAIKCARKADVSRTTSRFNIKPSEVDQMNRDLVKVIGSKPVTRIELTERIKPLVSKNIRTWMENVWGTFRPAVVEGLLCYGPEQGPEVTYVRADNWLPKQKDISDVEARQILFRRFMRAYGPATVHDFAKWAGIAMQHAKETKDAVQDDLIEVNVEGAKAFILREDLKQLLDGPCQDNFLRLLPGFDSYLLAHVSKDHLVQRKHYKRVYRNQGWISNVVLLGGRIIAIWSYKRSASRIVVTIEPLESLSRTIRQNILDEADNIASFLGIPCNLTFQKS